MNVKTITSILTLFILSAFTQVIRGQDSTDGFDLSLSHYPDIKAPDSLYVIDKKDMSGDEYIMITTLQGNLAQDKPRIYITDEGSRDSDFYWLNKMVENHGVTTEERSDAMALLDEFQDEVDGYIIGNWDTPSLNTATSLAGIKNGFVIPEALESKVRDLGFEQIADAREIEPGSVFDDFKEEFNNSILFTSENHIVEMRDYMIAAGGMVYHEEAEVEGDYFDQNAVYSWIEDDSPQIGWGGIGEHDEFVFVNDATEGGLFTNPANWNKNLSVLAGVQQGSLKQNGTEATTDNIETPEEAHYLAINMSDGDNYAYALQGLADEDKYFGSPARGEFAMNWTIPGSMIELAPAAMEWYYDEASYNDYFVIGGTGAGYMFPSRYPHLEEHLEIVNEYMGRSDLSYVGMLDPVDFGNDAFYETASKYTQQPNIEGVYYLNYWQYEKGDGQMEFIDGKPVVAMRENMWDLSESEILDLADKISNYSKNPENPNAYTIMNLHAWSHNLEDAKLLVDNLEPHVQVVNMDEFFQQIKKNVDPDFDPYADISFGDNLLQNSDFSDGFDQWKLFKDHSLADFQDVNEIYFSGQDSQILSYQGYNLMQVFSNRYDAEPEKHYKLRVKTQVTGEHGNAANYKIRFYDDNGEFIDEVEEFMPENTDGFVYEEAVMQAPVNTSEMDVELAVWSEDTDLEIQIDEVLLKPETERTTSTEPVANHPDRYKLEQNYPNPFNPTTKIRYRLPEDSQVEVAVYNVMGRRIETLVNKYQKAGSYEVNFDATGLSSGLYFYKLSSGEFIETRQMQLIK